MPYSIIESVVSISRDGPDCICNTLQNGKYLSLGTDM